MKNLYTKFNSAVRWNTLEAFLYQIILYMHSMAVFVIVGVTFFGIVGTIFSLIFLLIPLLGLGFDKALIINFNTIIENKANLKKIFIKQFIMQFLLLSLSFPIFIFLDNPLDLIFCSKALCYNVNRFIWIIAAFIVVSEGLRKSLRTFMQLAFKNKYTSVIEISTLVIYLTTVWTSYYITNNITLEIIFVPFLLQSLIALVALIVLTLKFATQLSNKSNNHSAINWSNINKSRQQGYLFQISNAFFSGNFLIPLFAYQFGLDIAGYLKLFSYLGGIGVAFSEKIVGITSGALFLWLQNDNNAKTLAFNKIKNQFILLLTILSTAILMVYLFSNHQTYSGSGILFLLALTLENFYIIYEKYFLIQNKILYIFFINLVSALVFISFFLFFSFSLEQIISTLISIRVISFGIIAKLSKRYIV